VPIDHLLTVEQVAAILGMRKSWVYERTLRGEIPCVKLGALLRFDPEDISRYVEAHKAGQGKRPAPNSDFGDHRAETLVRNGRASRRPSRASKV
jgi:excisionase family DNA binding protein